MRPSAPTRKWWSIRLWPSSPELDPSPPGQMSVAERRSSQVELSVEAQRKTIFATWSVTWLVTASSTRTPVARFLSLSYNTSVAIANGCSVRRPVFTAAGSVDDCVLKYAPYGQPRPQALRYWQGLRPGSGRVRLAVRAEMRRRRRPNFLVR